MYKIHLNCRNVLLVLSHETNFWVPRCFRKGNTPHPPSKKTLKVPTWLTLLTYQFRVQGFNKKKTTFHFRWLSLQLVRMLQSCYAYKIVMNKLMDKYFIITFMCLKNNRINQYSKKKLKDAPKKRSKNNLQKLDKEYSCKSLVL